MLLTPSGGLLRAAPLGTPQGTPTLSLADSLNAGVSGCFTPGYHLSDHSRILAPLVKNLSGTHQTAWAITPTPLGMGLSSPGQNDLNDTYTTPYNISLTSLTVQHLVVYRTQTSTYCCPGGPIGASPNQAFTVNGPTSWTWACYASGGNVIGPAIGSNLVAGTLYNIISIRDTLTPGNSNSIRMVAWPSGAAYAPTWSIQQNAGADTKGLMTANKFLLGSWGGGGYGGSGSWNGPVVIIRVWARALTQGEANLLMWKPWAGFTFARDQIILYSAPPPSGAFTATLNETAHGVETASVTAATKSLTETAHGVEIASVTAAAKSLAETAHGAETSSVTAAAKSLAEQGHGSDTPVGLIVGAQSRAEQAHGQDTPVVTAATRAATEQGHGRDTFALTVYSSLSEQGHGQHTQTITAAAKPATEQAHGGDTPAVTAAAKSLAEDVHGQDTPVPATSGARAATEQAHGYDTPAVIAATRQATEQAHGNEALTPAAFASRAAAEQAHGQDTAIASGAGQRTDLEQAHGQDASTVIAATRSLAEDVHGNEALSPTVASTRTATDQAHGQDAPAVIAATRSLSEDAHGSEGLYSGNYRGAYEQAHAHETIQITAFAVQLVEQARGRDIPWLLTRYLSYSDTAHGIEGKRYQPVILQSSLLEDAHADASYVINPPLGPPYQANDSSERGYLQALTPDPMMTPLVVESLPV